MEALDLQKNVSINRLDPRPIPIKEKIPNIESTCISCNDKIYYPTKIEYCFYCQPVKLKNGYIKKKIDVFTCRACKKDTDKWETKNDWKGRIYSECEHCNERNALQMNMRPMPPGWGSDPDGV